MKEIARLVRYIAVLTKRLAYLRSLAAPGRADLEAIEWIEKELPAMQEALATLRAAAARAIVPEAVTAVAPEVAASVSLGFRVAVSVSLVLGIIVLLGMASYYGYRHYCRPETSPPNLGQGTDPNGAGGAFTNHPLTEEVKTTLPGPGNGNQPPTNPAASGSHRLIDVPAGAGPDEFIPEIPIRMTSGGPVSAATDRAVTEWRRRIDAAMPAFTDFSDGWENRVRFFGPRLAVVKADLRQEGSRVSGWIWIVRGERQGGFDTVKLPVTGSVAGEPGAERLTFQAGGAITGTLVLVDRGSTIRGTVNGSAVTLYGKRAGDARTALEARDPSPLRR